MSKTLINAIRELGWPDSHGHWQYGNAAVLCYLSSSKAMIGNLDANKMRMAQEFIQRHANDRVTKLCA